MVFSMGFALIVLLLTSGNLLITLYAMLTIIFIIADTVAIFVLFGWELSILQTIIIIMSVGLSVDFSEKKNRKNEFETKFVSSSRFQRFITASRTSKRIGNGTRRDLVAPRRI